MSTKISVYFNFGPDDSYFLRCGAQHRSTGNIAGRQGRWTDNWMKFDCVAWKPNFYFACRQGYDRVNQNFAESQIGAPDPNFVNWMKARERSPLRLVLGETPGNWFAWMISGDFIAGPNAPTGMVDAARKKMYTGIRCASIGANKTWLLIWDDGDKIYNFPYGYPKLYKWLQSLEGDGIYAEDVSWVALNPFREEDYFLYVDKTKTAYFQVSEAFGGTLEDVLRSEGITSTDIVLREQQVVKPVKIYDITKHVDFVKTATNTVGVSNDALVNSTVKVVKTTYQVIKIGTKIGTALAGAALCNVM